MTSADNANLWIVDHDLRSKAQMDGIEILESPEAWAKYEWTHQYFAQEPSSGYFMWIKKQPSCALFSCVNIKGQNIKQDLQNLTVIEAGIQGQMSGTCAAMSLKLKGTHQAQGKVILRKGAQMQYSHIHRWGKKDVVMPNYEFILEDDAQLDYTYKITKCPENIDLKNKFILQDRAKVQLNIVADCQNTNFNSLDEIVLQGDESSGMSTLKFVARENSQIKAYSRLLAEGAGTGHLDCESLNLADSAEVSLIPDVTVKNKNAQVTHEASIGKVSQDQLNYLQMRGLSEEQAIELIASGFLKVAEEK